MLELLLALAAEPVVQTAPAETTASLVVVNTAFIVSTVPFQGHVRVVVQNTGAEPDELIAVSTPLGEALEFRTDGDLFSSAAPAALPLVLPPPRDGKPSYLPLVVRIHDLETGDFWSTGASVTLRFARAGEMTVALRQSSPAPPPPARQ